MLHSELKHRIKQSRVLPFYPSHFSRMGPFQIKTAVSRVSNTVSILRSFAWHRVNFTHFTMHILMSLLNKRIRAYLALSRNAILFKFASRSAIVWFCPWVSYKCLWVFAISTLSFCLKIFVRYALIGGCFFKHWASLHFYKGNARRLPAMIVVKKIISPHKINRIILSVGSSDGYPT